jgi:hypothetical protein
MRHYENEPGFADRKIINLMLTIVTKNSNRFLSGAAPCSVSTLARAVSLGPVHQNPA